MSFVHVLTALLLLLVHGGFSSPVTSFTPSDVAQNPARRDAATTYSPYTLPRLVIYFQTTHDASGRPISLLPLITEKGIALTHLIVCSFHVGADGAALLLNDYPPSDARFQTLWREVQTLQAAGVRVMGMVGGAAAGSFAADTLDSTDSATFEAAYGPLHDAIAAYGLQGMDLDVEQSMSQAGITRLVERLAHDFGDRFEVTLAPVASALLPGGGGPNLSGFSYAALASTIAASPAGRIAFYNAQFYNGFGSLATPDDYEAIATNNGVFTPQNVLLGQITSPAEGGDYVAPGTLKTTVAALRAHYGTGSPLGGVMGWEYFDSEPGGSSAPWEWAQDMTAILRPGQTPAIVMTQAEAEELTATYKASTVQAPGNSGVQPAAQEPGLDYLAMVNA
ncbi:chitinase [Sporothrix schenckii 1099-18]|uniref:Chitinase n=1 Tax=Sporothrix schenckii 1099-18 TaxID=1397361 RepID=A0A0F2M9B3_SPOSC|nr:chitinase [Sporothrix schenckii 1099-18]KJR86227.1 chitinase [Sporothrix schenckii 1099-18]